MDFSVPLVLLKSVELELELRVSDPDLDPESALSLMSVPELVLKLRLAESRVLALTELVSDALPPMPKVTGDRLLAPPPPPPAEKNDGTPSPILKDSACSRFVPD